MIIWKDERRRFLQSISSDIILTPYESRDRFIVRRPNMRRIVWLWWRIPWRYRPPLQKCFQNNSFQTPLCSVHTIISCKKDPPIPDTAAKGVDMPHTNKPYKSSYRYRRYCHFPRISSSFLLCAYIIAFFRCRFGKETSAAQYPPVRNLEAVPLLRYNNAGSYLYHWI